MTEQLAAMPRPAIPAVSLSRRPMKDEWLVTNGLGGYASGTISGACTRRYHGLLIAALPVPLGRILMLNHLAAEILLPDDHVIQLDREELPDDSVADQASLGEFQLEMGLPVWRYVIGPYHVEKRIVLPHLQNTVMISYRLVDGPTRIRLRMRPSFCFRAHEAPVDLVPSKPYAVSVVDGRIEIHSEAAPPLRLRIVAPDAGLLLDGGSIRRIRYRLEEARGYEYSGMLWSPGYFRARLNPGEEAMLLASTEEWDTMLSADGRAALQAELDRRTWLVAQAQPEARTGMGTQLVLAADQFLIRPSGRVAELAVAQAAGDDVRSVIAGYHWFTDWGRDTMISLEGLALATGRYAEAGFVLRAYARYVRDGLLPNLFPEGQREGLYHTADATLWYFHALERYVRATSDHQTQNVLIPTFRDIVEHHVRGTRFGIRVDPSDDLLTQGDAAHPLTWMDAKVGDWIVTPRRGKTVEINALWYNALCLLERWCSLAGDDREAAALARRAERVRQSFNERFWCAETGCLYDIVDGEHGVDRALRPNQLFAISLDHPVLDKARWQPVLDKVTERLLTPLGLRSLAPEDPSYKPTYDGDLRARDAAYHQGTVWAWLIGPFIDAWLRVRPNDLARARAFLSAFEQHLDTACIGSISEIFNAKSPFLPRGCIAQAWSVAEVLRAWVKTAASSKDGQPTAGR